jgi:hypothetical protein
VEQRGEWLNLSDASHRLGLSIQTLRRRIKKQKIQSRLVENRFGSSYEVWVDQDYSSEVEGLDRTTPEESSGVDRNSHQEGESTHLELIRLVDKLHQENRGLVEAATVWQARAGMLAEQLSFTQAQLGEAHQTIKMLEAPKVETKQDDQLQVGSEPWWKRWWSALG